MILCFRTGSILSRREVGICEQGTSQYQPCKSNSNSNRNSNNNIRMARSIGTSILGSGRKRLLSSDSYWDFLSHRSTCISNSGSSYKSNRDFSNISKARSLTLIAAQVTSHQQAQWPIQTLQKQCLRQQRRHYHTSIWKQQQQKSGREKRHNQRQQEQQQMLHPHSKA